MNRSQPYCVSGGTAEEKTIEDGGSRIEGGKAEEGEILI
jgi:hypothetical protein